MSNLSRKKITVKSKRGKTYQRSVMVKDQQPQPGAWHMIKNHGAQIAGRGALIGTASLAGQHAGAAVAGKLFPRSLNGHILATTLGGVLAANQAYGLLYRPNSVRAQRITGDYSRSSWGGKVAFAVLHYGSAIGAQHVLNKGRQTAVSMYNTRRREAEARRQSR